jgi:hypothetical protein
MFLYDIEKNEFEKIDLKNNISKRYGAMSCKKIIF